MTTLPRTLFITGIDTDAGKSYATGWLAGQLQRAGHTVATQKFIQTGNVGTSEDIALHRRLMGGAPLPEDAEGLTAPVIFSYPASAQLAARLDGRDIPLDSIRRATATLQQRYDYLLIEGAGGLIVPLTDTYSTIDYIADERLPVALVTNARLGSINHTMLALEALDRRGIPLAAVLWNTFLDARNPLIADDTRAYIRRHIPADTPFYEVPVMGEQ